jgi:phosphoribosylformylglycinamidine (FGAM) synthase-like enzyme
LLHLKKGPPPEVNLDDELKNGEIILNLIKNNQVQSVHDVSSGGIILTILEMCISSEFGANVVTNRKDLERIKYLFGEDQSRYIVEVDKSEKLNFEQNLKNKNINFESIGNVSKDYLTIDSDLKIEIKDLIKLNNSWFYDYNK